MKPRKPHPDRPLIVFDIGNVLLCFDVAKAIRNFDRVTRGHGRDLAERLWFSPLNRRFESGLIPGRGLFGILKKQLDLRCSYAAFCRAFNDIFTPVKSNLEILKRLSKNYHVALLSNTNAIHWDYIFRKYKRLKHAHFPCASHLFKAMKPNPKIYRALAKETGYPLNRMIYIDDRPELIRAAAALGLKGLCYTGRRPLAAGLAKRGIHP